ncbi:MAG: NADH-quinone oxidoreductase subunit C [Chloroflexi bacterium]|nr:NADH-quinone oxidoreductase subunit C [Chloroflexota bacterium]
MDTEKALQTASDLLQEWTISSHHPEEGRLDCVIEAKNIKAAVNRLLVEEHWGYLSAITGLDNAEYGIDEATKEKKLLPGKGSLELLYHFCQGAAITTLRVSLPYSAPDIDSICDIISSVSLYEREAAELFGVHFAGTPSTEHLILPDGWPEGVYPLRKTFTGLEKEVKG